MHGNYAQGIVGETVSLYLPDDGLYFDVFFSSYSPGGGFSYTRTSIENETMSINSINAPENFSIVSIYPNPFNPSTKISFTLNQFSSVEMQIYNLRGELIENLINERLNVGRHSILWNADSYSVGTYLLKIKAGHQVETRKLVLIK